LTITDSISSIIMNMLSISALLSAVIFHSAQSFSKSVFNLLTSVLTDVLSKLVMHRVMIYFESIRVKNNSASITLL
jgi:hypothetical protein